MLRWGRLAGCLLVIATIAPASHAVDPSARLPSGGSAWEYWDLIARLESGHLVTWRVLITNAGPGSQNGTAVGRVISPDGSIQGFDNGRRKSRWTLSGDRLDIDIGSSHLDLHGPVYRMQVDKSRVVLDLRITSEPGISAPEAATPDGYSLDVLAVSASIEGTLWIQGMDAEIPVRGRAALTHSWARQPEVELTRRRVEFFSLGSEDALYVIDFTAPDGNRSRGLFWRHASESAQASSEFALHLDGDARGRIPSRHSSDSRYWVPADLHLDGPEVAGRIRIGRALAEVNPLDHLPGPIRFLLSLGMRPRRVWTESSFELELARQRERVRLGGAGFVVVSFLDEFVRPDAARGLPGSSQSLVQNVGFHSRQPSGDRVEGTDLVRGENLGENRESDTRCESGHGDAVE